MALQQAMKDITTCRDRGKVSEEKVKREISEEKVRVEESEEEAGNQGPHGGDTAVPRPARTRDKREEEKDKNNKGHTAVPRPARTRDKREAEKATMAKMKANRKGGCRS